MKKFILSILLVSCTPAGLQKIDDARNTKDAVCAFAHVKMIQIPEPWARVAELCQEKATYKQIACAIAGECVGGRVP